MTFEFGKYRSQVLISLKFLSKNKDNELSAEKSKSYKYLMDKSVAKELVMDIDFNHCFEKKTQFLLLKMLWAIIIEIMRLLLKVLISLLKKNILGINVQTLPV